jgi:hypothetical protein
LISNILPVPDGSLLVYDTLLRRLTTFGPDLKARGETAMPRRPSLRLPDGTFIVAERIPTADRAGYPFHVVDSAGRVVRSFGTDDPTLRPRVAETAQRLVTNASDGSIWSVAPDQYIVDRWDPSTGKRLARLVVRSGSFSAPTGTGNDERRRPPSLFVGLWEHAGHIWFLLRVADTKWQPPAQANVERPFDANEYDRTFDWILEAVDVESGGVAANVRFGSVRWGGAPDLFLVSRNDNPTLFDVWSVTLERKRKG